ncbi:MAG: 3-dehydroquinate synthase [Clostridia bacterium]|nr:3-dehydroquinate synthase [Clostridia bacterium]
MKSINLNLPSGGYTITVGRNLLQNADKYFNLQRRVFILTDDGVPEDYAEMIAECSLRPSIYTVASGEGSKSLSTLECVLEAMLHAGLTRTDCVVAVGGGVVGDLGGFAAASYMRGIDFYNVPTTMLSQLDSSIGGKTAVNLGSVKNVVGAFHQPKAVLIDIDTLKTLDKRQISAGLAEAVKMSLTSDKALFERFENEAVTDDNVEDIIAASLMIKKNVVEIDEKESGLRKILNFGHTLGHGIEAEEGLSGLYHGECVALGMLPMCSPEVKERLIAVLKKLDLPTEYKGNIDNALAFVSHDKKCEGDSVSIITVSAVGEYQIKKLGVDDFISYVKERI